MVCVRFNCISVGLFVHLFSILGAGDRAWSNFTQYVVGDNAFYASAMNINNAVLIFMILIIKHSILISMQNFIHNFPLSKNNPIKCWIYVLSLWLILFGTKILRFCCLDLQRNDIAVWSLYPERKHGSIHEKRKRQAPLIPPYKREEIEEHQSFRQASVCLYMCANALALLFTNNNPKINCW